MGCDRRSVNEEMGPWLKFVPQGDQDLLAAASEGHVLRLKVKGPLGLPLGHYPLQIKRLEEARGFLEQTQMLPFLFWQHERTIEPADQGSTVTDQLAWSWKATFLNPLLRIGVRTFFKHRHRQLRQRFHQ